MAVDKALNPAPTGLTALQPDPSPEKQYPEPLGAELELEIILPSDEDEDEGAPEEAEEGGFNENLAEVLDEDRLATLASDLISEFDEDLASRKDWVQTYVDGLELLGMKLEDRTEPWPGACGVFHPLLSEALVRFQAETMMETFPAQGPVRTKILGEETPETRTAAQRVQADMNHQMTDVMVEYRPEHERMLWGLGLAGNAFKKVYYDPSLGRQTSMFLPAEDVVVPYGASSLDTAERVTHVMRKTPNEVRKLQANGFYRAVELGEPMDTLDEVEKAIAEKQGFRATTDDRFKVLEIHADLIIEGDRYAEEEAAVGVAVPYVVTIERGTSAVLAIRRNWLQSDEKKLKRQHFVHYAYVPGFGFYAFGLIHLVGAFAKSGTSLLRQLVDAGTLSNLPGGFKTKGLRVSGDDTPVGPGEFRDVDVASGTMRDNIMPLPYKEPSQVLFVLLQNIVEEGRRFAAAADLKISDMSAQAPVGTTLAILERTLKVMSAVQARVHYAMRQEFRLLKDIIRDHTDDDYTYTPEQGTPRAKRSDYDMVEVIPVSDPNAATMAQKIVQYQAVIQLAQTSPGIYDMPYLHRQMLEVLGIKNASKLVPHLSDDEMKPRDPVSENMDILNMKPVKAFMYQDHEAHLAVHMAAMQDPKIQAMVGQSPNAQAIMSAAAAHIQEHLAYEYRRQVEEQAGVPLPPPNAELDENTEVAISRLAAAAAQQLLQKNKAAQQQEQNQQAQQDPIVQMQQKELALKERELELKTMQAQIAAAEKTDRIDIERERIAAQKEIAGLNAGVKVAQAKSDRESREQLEGLRVGVEVAREAMRGEEQETPVLKTPNPTKAGATE